MVLIPTEQEFTFFDKATNILLVLMDKYANNQEDCYPYGFGRNNKIYGIYSIIIDLQIIWNILMSCNCRLFCLRHIIITFVWPLVFHDSQCNVCIYN